MEEIMEETKRLAIASIPCQTWNTVYEFPEALKNGTIFPELNLPFFATDAPEKPVPSTPDHQAKKPEEAQREALLTQIYQISFAINDLTLYLDTHCEDTNARELFYKWLEQKTVLMQEFASNYYPLTQECMTSCGCSKESQGKDAVVFAWTAGPLPWEGACV